MEDFESEIKLEFINEAIINLEEVEGCFLQLETTDDPAPLLDQIFRMAHNLKGGSRAVGFGDVAVFTHQLENLVQKIKSEAISLVPELVSVLLQSNDRLIQMLNTLKSDVTATFNNDDLIKELQEWLDGKTSSSEPAIQLDANELASEADSNFEPSQIEETPSYSNFEDSIPSEGLQQETTEENHTELNLETQPEVVPDVSSPKPNVQKMVDHSKNTKPDEVIRVNLSKIDALNDFVGELIVLQSVIFQQASSTNCVQLTSTLRQLSKLAKNIQTVSMGLRMLPVKPLVQKLQRVVRDTSQNVKKPVHFNVIGDQMDIDKSVLDQLGDPLVHILRNAIDHGLETLEERDKTSKPSLGTVNLEFRNEGNHLCVEVSDDGKGIDPNVIQTKAIEKGLIKADANLSEKQIINLIFHPGFSTKSVTSEISGRGVGMDVVKTNIEKIGGSVDVHSKIGNGSLFRLQIPLTLAVIDGLVVLGEKQRYVIPLSQISETINLETQNVFPSTVGIGDCFDLRGKVVPIFSIDNALGRNFRSANIKSGTALIVQIDEKPMAVVVKSIHKAQQIVIKPFGNGITPQLGWVGSCVLGDGQPALIVSPLELLTGVTQYFTTTLARENVA